jgi:RimJ/RimL family protein N-acetyltransferase
MEIRFLNYMIRSWELGDAPSLAKYANNINIWRNLRNEFPNPYTLPEAKDFLAKITAQKPETVFAIATPEEAIGGIGLIIGSDIHRYTAELGYWLAEPFWNRGIMTEAVKLITGYAFKNMKLNRIFAKPYDRNRASIRVLEKADYQFEGRLKGSAFKADEIIDELLYAKLKAASKPHLRLDSCVATHSLVPHLS